jgi:membrane-bound serine protease (ClpP class)
MGMVLATVFAFLLARFLPKSIFWNRMVLVSAVTGSSGGLTATESENPTGSAPSEGDIAVVVSDLHPGGRIEFKGRRFEARADMGEILAGQRVRIISRADFVYVVEPVK